MQNKNVKHMFKVAVLCIAISLLSFFAGAAAVSKPFYAISKGDDKNAAAVVDGQTDLQHLKPVVDVIKLIEDKYVKDVETEKLIEGAIKGVVESLGDPYSVYMNETEFQDFIASINGSFSGVGMVLSADESTGDIIVVSPIEGTPAQKAGILPKDIIVKVDDIELAGKSLDEAVKLLRGEKGTKVVVYIKRQDNEDLLEFELMRDDIRVTTIKHEIIDDDVGYIKITSFDSQTYDEFKAAVDSLQKQGIKGLILDLRNNPGGSLYESVRIADEILGKGMIVYTEDRNKNKLEEYYSDNNRISLPLVVLINENSASASEIVAGAIQDHKAGVLVGTKTFGKGSVQEIEPFQDGTGIKLTIARYYLPSGRSIDGIGVEPDIKVELSKDISPFDIPREKDSQLLKALDIVKSPTYMQRQER
ncbi:Carboxyl-terminal protease [Tepidanaerobacter acetatoxydans Re1]|uniref:Carboxyl-terminal protease n=1 Tax=Tepidanaerobacter acetatoxydans (strain DSM 21804 / JCM 16047 / Re1) TaxID=1209989 RepID=F4LWS0_TEPAE|nr:S41 family peptidase [Tepidanaerobacter acetatoxydans]AEE91792.1 carboxyl-terminal protease [Tepidanaerobacter acetatoxydans Re1]CCP26582.1 Carboxyl-terminal protease [Tepidanaerobacter acetatoxydans Re1]